MMNNLQLLVPSQPTVQRNFDAWATVTDDSPLRIRLDGEASSLPYAPDTLVWPLVIGDRVRVAFSINPQLDFHGRRAIISGRAGGDHPYTPTVAPRAVLRRVAAQPLANDTNIAVEWDTAVRDTHNGWADASTNPSRYTLPLTGQYDMFGLASWSANATNRRAVHLLLDGVGVNGTQIIATAQAVGATSLFFAGTIVGNAGQYVGVNMWQNSGIELNTGTALPTVSVTIEYKGT